MNAALGLAASFLVSLSSLSAQQTIPVLVKTRVPLTAAVENRLASYAQRVTFVWPQIRALALEIDPGTLPVLAADSRVELVEPDSEVRLPPVSATAIPEVLTTGHGNGGGATATGSLVAWNQDQVDTLDSGYDGTGVTIAVVDSGLPRNWDVTLPPGVRVDVDHAAGFAPMGDGRGNHQTGNGNSPSSYVGLDTHGLGVTSFISGYLFRPGGDLIVGGAPAATILPVKVFNQFGYGNWSWTIAGYLHVAELKRTGELSGPVIINYSGGGSFNLIASEAIDYAMQQGVLFVVAAGNEGDQGVLFPATKPEVITAAAAGFVDEFSTSSWHWGDVPENDPLAHYIATFSSRELPGVPTASQIDVLGPGDWTVGDWGYGNGVVHAGYSEGNSAVFVFGAAWLFGTSFAAPHVSAVLAQMLQKNPALTQAQAESILRSTALSIPPNPVGVTTVAQVVTGWGVNATGAGLMRGGAAVAATPNP